MGLLRVWGARERLLAYLGREGVNDMTREGLCELKKQENGELSPWKWIMFFASLKEWGLLINCRSGHDSEQVGKGKRPIQPTFSTQSWYMYQPTIIM